MSGISLVISSANRNENERFMARKKQFKRLKNQNPVCVIPLMTSKL